MKNLRRPLPQKMAVPIDIDRKDDLTLIEGQAQKFNPSCRMRSAKNLRTNCRLAEKVWMSSMPVKNAPMIADTWPKAGEIGS